MKYIRKPQRVDLLRSEVRPKKAGRIGRWVYLALLAALALYLTDLTAGHLFYLKAEGMLMRDSATVAPLYTARVMEIDVKRGDEARQGQKVARLYSQDVTDSIAKNSADVTRLRLAVTDMKVKAAGLEQAIPIAKKRAEASEQSRAEIESLKQRGLLTATNRARAVNDAYETYDEVRKLESEYEVFSRELAGTEASFETARKNLETMQSSYQDGVMVAPVDGNVAEVLTEPGAVLRPGDSILRIFHGETYALAYIPTGTLYRVKPGDPVAMRIGFEVLHGEVEALLPVASKLPAEFQKAFQTAQREQVIRIKLSGEPHSMPLFTTVDISSRTSPRVLMLSALRGLREKTGL